MLTEVVELFTNYFQKWFARGTNTRLMKEIFFHNVIVTILLAERW